MILSVLVLSMQIHIREAFLLLLLLMVNLVGGGAESGGGREGSVSRIMWVN